MIKGVLEDKMFDEVAWFIWSREEEVEGKLCGFLELPHKRSGGTDIDHFSLVTMKGPEEMERSCMKSQSGN